MLLEHQLNDAETVSLYTPAPDRCPLDATPLEESDLDEWTCSRGHKWYEVKLAPFTGA